MLLVRWRAKPWRRSHTSYRLAVHLSRNDQAPFGVSENSRHLLPGYAWEPFNPSLRGALKRMDSRPGGCKLVSIRGRPMPPAVEG